MGEVYVIGPNVHFSRGRFDGPNAKNDAKLWEATMRRRDSAGGDIPIRRVERKVGKVIEITLHYKTD